MNHRAETIDLEERNLSVRSDIIVRHLSEELSPLWERYIESTPRAMPFHHLGWMRAVKKSYQHHPHYLMACSQEGNSVLGVLPLFEVSGLLTGRALISIPYAVYGGILADSAEVHSLLLKKARQLAQRKNVNYLELRQGIPIDGMMNRFHYYTFHRELPNKPEEAINSFPRKARAAIRQSIRRYKLTSGFNPDYLDLFYKFYVNCLRHLASPPHDKQFFERLVQEYGANCLVQLVFYQGTPVGGLLSLRFQKQIHPYFAGIDRQYSYLNTSNFIYYSLMEHAIRQGMKVFDFGRTRRDNIGSCNFKKNQGFSPHPLHYSFYSPKGSDPPDLRPSNWKFSAAQAIWKQLPPSLVSSLGSRITRWIP